MNNETDEVKCEGCPKITSRGIHFEFSRLNQVPMCQIDNPLIGALEKSSFAALLYIASHSTDSDIEERDTWEDHRKMPSS